MFADVSMMLALSVYEVVINEKLPTNSDTTPLLGKSDYWYSS